MFEVSRALRPSAGDVDPGFWAVPDGKRLRALLPWDYTRYVKLTALNVQYVRAMERRHSDRDEIRAPKHPVQADTIAQLRAVDRDPDHTWSAYEECAAMRPPGQ